MKIMIDQVLKDLNGQEFKYPLQKMNKKTKKLETVEIPYTLNRALVVALSLEFPTEPAGTKDKLFRYDLLKRIYLAEKVIEISRKEYSYLKRLIGKSFQSPVFVGRAIEALDE